MEDIRKLIERRRKFIQLIYRYFCLDKTIQSIINEIEANFQINLEKSDKEILKRWVYIIDEAVEFISSNVSTKWSWERLPHIHQAVLVNGYFEITDEKREKAIVINEMLKLSFLYLPSQDNKYINAILDKL
ncbi:transcription antitermination factor NusB [Spiroplasma endosymbiont of Aspidapion aeneum]|uniref:transcription antitermination factor NusB n=1 Tax=Spiroplasma endosymbiont of Aspidapion aeneum TaxID=3066276 RepID=UPI00313D7E66